MSNIFITIEMRLPVRYTEEDGVIVSHCPVLDISSMGDDEDEAAANLKDAIIGFVESCYDRGVLDKVLSECGFQRIEDLERDAIGDMEDVIIVPVPLYMLNKSQPAGKRCRA